MRRAIALVLLLALPAFAQDAQAVDGGVLLPDAKVVEIAQRIVKCEAERETYKAAVPALHPALLAVIVGLVAAGAGFGAGFGVASAKK